MKCSYKGKQTSLTVQHTVFRKKSFISRKPRCPATPAHTQQNGSGRHNTKTGVIIAVSVFKLSSFKHNLKVLRSCVNISNHILYNRLVLISPEYSETAWEGRCEERFVYRLFKTKRRECEKGETIHQIFIKLDWRILHVTLLLYVTLKRCSTVYSLFCTMFPGCSFCDQVDGKRTTISQRRREMWKNDFF